MKEEDYKGKSVLITGGTSGLGLELVRLFLKKGFNVVATGRQTINLPGFEERFKLLRIDFSNLKDTARSISGLCKSSSFDYVINNAGILSPPDYTESTDGLEYTFQVNFLAHLLVNEIIVRNKPDNLPLRIAAVTSPVYKLTKVSPAGVFEKKGYLPFKAYSYSKLYLIHMCRELSDRYPLRNITSFSFDPGTFSSSIYRMRGRLFRVLYLIAAPFMRKPENVAYKLFKILTGSDALSGAIYGLKGKPKYLPATGFEVDGSFWSRCYDKIEPLLN